MTTHYIAGVFATVTWEMPFNEERVYISFSPDRGETAYDDYGVRDDTVFYYAERSELSELLEPYNGRGWRITEIHMTNMVKHTTPNTWL